jgi:hypothetical protein
MFKQELHEVRLVRENLGQGIFLISVCRTVG